jgi:hypothetical protein
MRSRASSVVFLANLLPGLRELRAPLAAGYAALLAAFVWLGGRLPSGDQQEGVLGDLQHAAKSLGTGVSLAIVSFVAYLLGSLIADVGGAFFARLGRSITARGRRNLTDLAARACEAAVGPRPTYRRLSAVATTAAKLTERPKAGPRELPWDAPFMWRGLDALKETRWAFMRWLGGTVDGIRSAVGNLPGWLRWWKSWTVVTPSELYPRKRWRRAWTRRDPGERVYEARRARIVGAMTCGLADATYKELDMVGTRLIGERSELYGAVDRLRSEAELRQAVTLPLELLAIGLIVRGAWMWGVPLLVAAACLPAQGRRRIKAANDLLSEALLLERVKAPTLERFLLETGVEKPVRP